MRPTIGALAGALRAELSTTHTPFQRYPLTLAWICELLAEVQQRPDPEAGDMHLVKCAKAVGGAGNVPTAQVMRIVAEWYTPGTHTEPAHTQCIDQHLRELMQDLGVRVLRRLSAAPDPRQV